MDQLTLIKTRAKLKESIRNYFKQLEYMEVDTPIVVNSPGTEVYL